MTTSVLEQTRQLHEDIEIREKVAARLLNEKEKRPPKFHPCYDNAILRSLLSVQESSRRLLELYVDKDGLRKEEILVLGGQKRIGENVDEPPGQADESAKGSRDDDRTVWLNFYDELKTVKDLHKRGTNNLAESLTNNEILKDVATLSTSVLESCDVDQLFTAEEHFGRRVDMNFLFLEFTNLKNYRSFREQRFKQDEISRMKKKLQAKKTMSEEEIKNQLDDAATSLQFQEFDYIQYLKMFDDFQSMPRFCKYKDADYKQYLSHLLEYIQRFIRRVNPLSNYEGMLEHFNNEFNPLWEKKRIRSWETPTHQMPTYSLPTDRLFASQGTLNSHKEGKKYKKALRESQALSIEEQKKRIDESEAVDRELANMEFLIQREKDILASVIQNTIEHLQKKQSRTVRELEMDEDDSGGEENAGAIVLAKKPDEDAVSEGGGSDDEKPIYNPLNLPLGWDGKPIPFWLYKLHGLGVEYKCEICGNYSYWGRRAFERHFQEWRHAFGMRCLKIPNTVHFKEVTKIEDAVLLYEKLKKKAETQMFKADQDVECEDSEGNVMSAKTFEDLRRQGLL